MPASFRVSAGHVEAAERVNADERARAFAIEVEIANMKFTPRAFELLRVVCIDSAGQTELRIVGNPERVVKILRANDCQHRPEDFFLLNGRARFDICNHCRLDEESLLAVR